VRVVIIGGGVAGATLARELKEFDVTLIQDKIWDKPCGGGVKAKIFEEFNLPKKLIKNSTKKIEVVYHGKKYTFDLKGENLVFVNRKEFDNYLRESSNAKIIYSRFKDIDENRVILKNNQKIEFDILIGADGVNSLVRKRLNLNPIPKVLTHYQLVKLRAQIPKFYFDKRVGGDYYAWLFPHNNLSHIGSINHTFINFAKYLFITPKPKGYFIPTWQKNIQIQKDNIYFVGDAAGQVMPLSFEGIYYAMHSARILANSIKNGLDYKNEWDKRFLKEFLLLKRLENLMKKNFGRSLIFFGFKFKKIREFAINLWLGE